MARYTKEFQDRCLPLIQELGGDRPAVQAAHAIVGSMGITSLVDLRAHYERMGPVPFSQEITDLRNVGKSIYGRIMDLVLVEEAVT